MRPFEEFPAERLAAVRFVLTDVDDTLTDGARLSAATYGAIARLADAGVRIVPVTAGPAGWCDLMCRMWPVAAVIGENGGLCFRHDPRTGSTERRYWASAAERRRDGERLAALGARVREGAPGSEPAADQRWREVTLAFCNPGPPLAERLGELIAAEGARTVTNSLWVLGWFAGFDKLAMTRRMLQELFGADVARDRAAFLYVGDSLNDEPMFKFFPNSVGVATVRHYVGRMATPPRWVTRGGGGAGFVEIADALLRQSRSA